MYDFSVRVRLGVRVRVRVSVRVRVRVRVLMCPVNPEPQALHLRGVPQPFEMVAQKELGLGLRLGL